MHNIKKIIALNLCALLGAVQIECSEPHQLKKSSEKASWKQYTNSACASVQSTFSKLWQNHKDTVKTFAIIAFALLGIDQYLQKKDSALVQRKSELIGGQTQRQITPIIRQCISQFEGFTPISSNPTVPDLSEYNLDLMTETHPSERAGGSFKVALGVYGRAGLVGLYKDIQAHKKQQPDSQVGKAPWFFPGIRGTVCNYLGKWGLSGKDAKSPAAAGGRTGRGVS